MLFYGPPVVATSVLSTILVSPRLQFRPFLIRPYIQWYDEQADGGPNNTYTALLHMRRAVKKTVQINRP